ncbi:TonB-dependent receptor domain-containing protein [Stigmatella aurantiaca]|uniref:TonB-dependent receptor n=1 Tax=Stigmatella aurantiaca (strain DW4/3-1) TaxID=378806 RepID=Q08Z46_STIAD|nr:TonB-dependent receptor [Stigmatella aurantiaca]ADO74496.1 TonB-dependent receptor [Stigmatella aurantiaca DW4/3-1]EAU65738.1 vitamin B12 transporter BtuB [Stigmatella aurantiaca DW4/3-1]
MKITEVFKRAGILALCLSAGNALADERLEARRHFRNGMSLISQGEFDKGIAELQEAYAIKPHPSVVYNIARAYLDAGRTAEALEWYQLYLQTNPADAASVRATIARLEEAVKAAEPANLAQKLPMPPPPGTPPAPAAPAPDAQAMARLLERLEKAIARAESLPVAAPPTAPTASSSTSSARPAVPQSEDEGAVPYEERVVTASRRAQSALEAPNATTVITAEDIRLSGATSLLDVLRRVPGADVMEMGVTSANLSFRGFNQRMANKVLVLVDGRTEYQDFLGMTLWANFPIGMEEIDRIEVIRGPGSALYGANAMLGVVNIITQAPGSGDRQFIARAGGGNTVSGSFLSHGAAGGLRYRLSVGYGQEDKWSRDFESDRPDVAQTTPLKDLGYRGARANLATTYTFDSGVDLGVSSGVHRYYTEVYPLGTLRNFFLDGLSAYAKTDIGLGPVKLKGFWNHTGVEAGPQFEAIGQRPLSSRVDFHVFNGEALFSKGFQLAGEHQLNVGVEGRFKRVIWSYLSPGPKEEFHTAAFVQDEWRPVDPFRLVASYRMDRHPLLSQGKPGLAHSPRVSAILMPLEGHAFRATAASAFREPAFLESYTQLPVPVPGVPGASALTLGNRTLRPERLVAYELGYRGEAPTLGIDWDVALYQNTVKDLIGLSPLERMPAGESFDPVTGTYLAGRSFFQNEQATYTSRGAEVGVSLSPVDGLGLKASAALQKVTAKGEEEEHCAPCSQAPQLRLYGGLTYRTRADLEFGVDAAFTSDTTWIEREPDLGDPTRIDFSANKLPAYTVLNARVGYSVLQDRLTVAVVGSNLGSNHFQHPFGNRVERRVYATVTVTP